MVIYNENIITDGIKIRSFDSNVDPMELKWHWDEADRICIPLESNGWQFQFDNELPFEMENNIPINIPYNAYHRIIKGHGNLKLLIIEPEYIKKDR